MNLQAILNLLQANPQLAVFLKPVVAAVLKEFAQELNKPEVQKQIVDAIFGAIQPVKN